MSRLTEWWRRLAAIVRPGRWDREFDAEREAHLQMAADDLERQGLNKDAARRAARLAFGGQDAAIELQRDARGWPLLDTLRRDFLYACRGLRRDAGLAISAILILGIGIGANTAVFSLVRPVLLKPLPFERTSELVWIANAGQGDGLSGQTFQVDAYESMAREAKSFQDWTAYFAFSDFGTNTLVEHGNAERVFITDVAPRFFELLGVRPAVGRLFDAQEYAPNSPRVVLIGHDYWLKRFGGRPEIVGTYVTINDRPRLVAGVLPASFDFASVFAPGTRVDFFAPAILNDMRQWGNTLSVVARLAPGATIERARAELDVLRPLVRSANARVFPFGTSLTPLQERVSGPMRRPLFILWGAVGLVLLIVCANVSNLLLARSTARSKEFAVRLALGASRRRIFQQLALEGVVLASLGAAIGVPLAYGLTQWIKQGTTLAIPLLHHAQVDLATLGITAALSLSTALVFSILPALRLSRVHPQSALVAQSRGTTAGRQHVWVRSSLVVAEVALATVLLIGAGLLGRSLLRLLDADLGFRPTEAIVVTLKIDDSKPNVTLLLADVVRRIAAIPGVTAAGLTDALPLARNRSWNARVPGQVYSVNRRPPDAFVYIVGPGYLPAMGMSLIAGRDFATTDTDGSPRAVIVSQSLARTVYPDQDPIGRPLQVRQGAPSTIVGVVADVRQSSLDEPIAPQMYLPFAQGEGLAPDLIVRSSIDAGALVPSIRRELAAIDPTLLATDVKPLADLVDRSVSPRRFLVSLLGGFSLFALLLSSLGIYGVVSYGVSERVQEIGVRMALGATAGTVQRQVLGGTLRIALLGLAIGLAGAAALSRLIGALLFETSPTDLGTFGWTALTLLAVAMVSGYLPARRASRIAPMRALRT
jgi:predicted permease